MEDLAEVLEVINYDEEVWLVAVTGEGEAFRLSDKLPLEQREKGMNALAAMDRPLIMGLGGAVWDAGLELALCADICLVAESAQLGFSPHWLPVPGTIHRLTRLVGENRALELLLTNRVLGAREANAWGLVCQVVADDAVVTTAHQLSLELAQKAPIALRYIKEAVHLGLDMSLEQGLRLEADLSFLLHTTQDRREGIRAFCEKRRPVFVGK